MKKLHGFAITFDFVVLGMNVGSWRFFVNLMEILEFILLLSRPLSLIFVTRVQLLPQEFTASAYHEELVTTRDLAQT